MSTVALTPGAPPAAAQKKPGKGQKLFDQQA
jgi:hypothetical protein